MGYPSIPRIFTHIIKKGRIQKERIYLYFRPALDAESAEYVEALQHSQLFNHWVTRRAAMYTSERRVLDRFEHAISNHSQFKTSYTKCYEFLRGNNLNAQQILHASLNVKRNFTKHTSRGIGKLPLHSM